MATVRSSSLYEPGSFTTSHVLSRPLGTVNGNLLIAYFVGRHTTVPGSVTHPAGWNQLHFHAQNFSGGNTIVVAWKLADGEPLTWTWTTSSSIRAAGGVIRIDGHHKLDPIGANWWGHGSTSNITFGNIQGIAGGLELFIAGVSSNVSGPPDDPVNMTNVRSTSNGSGLASSAVTASRRLGNSGWTLAKNYPSTGDHWSVFNLMVRPYPSARISTDFTGTNLGQSPPGWYEKWPPSSSANNAVYTVQSDGSAFGNRYLRAHHTGGNRRAHIAHVDFDGSEYVEIIARMRYRGTDTTNRNYLYLLSDESPTGQTLGYWVDILPSVSSVRAGLYAPTFTVLNDTVLNIAPNTWIWVRTQRTGTTFRTKAWIGNRGDEPATWNVNNNTNTTFSVGSVGIGWWRGSGDYHDFDWLSMTNDASMPAQYPTINTNFPVIVQGRASQRFNRISALRRLFRYTGRANVVRRVGHLKEWLVQGRGQATPMTSTFHRVKNFLVSGLAQVREDIETRGLIRLLVQAYGHVNTRKQLAITQRFNVEASGRPVVQRNLQKGIRVLGEGVTLLLRQRVIAQVVSGVAQVVSQIPSSDRIRVFVQAGRASVSMTRRVGLVRELLVPGIGAIVRGGWGVTRSFLITGEGVANLLPRAVRRFYRYVSYMLDSKMWRSVVYKETAEWTSKLSPDEWDSAETAFTVERDIEIE